MFTFGILWLNASAFPVEGMDDMSDQCFLRCKVGLVREAKITDRDLIETQTLDFQRSWCDVKFTWDCRVHRFVGGRSLHERHPQSLPDASTAFSAAIELSGGCICT